MSNQPEPELFQGYDSFRSALRTRAVSGVISVSGAAENEKYAMICEDVESMQSALKVNASASASFAFGSASAKVDFSRQFEMTQHSVALVVYVNVKAGTQQVTSVHFDGTPPATPSAASDFFRSNGDSYVSSVTKGGEFYAVYHYQAESSEEKEDIVAELKGHTLNVNADLQTSISTAQSKRKTLVTVKMGMIGVSEVDAPTNDSEIIDFASKFWGRPMKAAKVIDFGVTGYERVGGMQPSAFSSIVDNRTKYQGAGGALGGLLKDYADLRKAVIAGDFIASVYNTFGYNDGDLALVSSRTAQARLDMDTIESTIDQMAADPTQTIDVIRPLGSLSNGVPSMNYTVNYTDFYGGTVGDTFPGDADRSSVQKRIRMTGVQANIHRFLEHKGDTLPATDLMQFRANYTSPNGTTTRQYGNDGSDGAWSAPWNVPENDHVKEVFIIYENHVHKIVLTTETAGIALPDDDNPHRSGGKMGHWVKGTKDAFLGFAVRSRGWIHALSVIYATFQPATWKPIPKPLFAKAASTASSRRQATV